MTNRNDENALKALRDFVEANSNLAQARHDVCECLPGGGNFSGTVTQPLLMDKTKLEEARDRVVLLSSKADALYKILEAWSRDEDILEAKLKLNI